MEGQINSYRGVFPYCSQHSIWKEKISIHMQMEVHVDFYANIQKGKEKKYTLKGKR